MAKLSGDPDSVIVGHRRPEGHSHFRFTRNVSEVSLTNLQMSPVPHGGSCQDKHSITDYDSESHSKQRERFSASQFSLSMTDVVI
jgi:hypothetical protein